MLSDPAREFLAYLRHMARDAKQEAKRQEAAKRHFDAECVRMQREEIRLVRDNGLSRISWKHYE